MDGRIFSYYTYKYRLFVFVFFLLAIIVASGTFGFYLTERNNYETRDYLDAIDYAREAQFMIQRQIQCWYRILLTADDPDAFREEYYRFSWYASRAQDFFGKLAILCSDFQIVSEKIKKSASLHNEVSRQYYTALLGLLNARSIGTKTDFRKIHQPEKELLNQIEMLVIDIKHHSLHAIEKRTAYYRGILATVLLLLGVIAITISFQLIRSVIDQHRMLRREIGHTARILNRKRKELLQYEEKFRRILEWSNEILFSLDDQFRITNINKAFSSVLKMNPSDVRGKSFFDLIASGSGDTRITKDLIREKMKELSSGMSPVTFLAEFSVPNLRESKTMQIWLERVGGGDYSEILGHASLPPSAVEGSIVRETVVVQIENSILAADEITYRLTSSLAGMTAEHRVRDIRIALREIIINAIEHGNLNISFEEKTAALMEDRYFDLIAERKNDERYKGKKVSITYHLEPKKATYHIADEGEGFDHARILDKHRTKSTEDMLPHGRGITMAAAVFDEVVYNKKGNEVTLVKYFIPVEEPSQEIGSKYEMVSA